MSSKVGPALSALAILAVAVIASHTAESRRPDPPVVATPASAEPRLYAVPPSPFIHGSVRGSIAPRATPEASRAIEFANGITLDTRAIPPAAAAANGSSAAGYYLVQFDGPIFDEWRRSLEATGAAIIASVPDHTYLVRLGAGDLGRVSGLAHVAWTGVYRAAYKVAPAGQFDAAARAVAEEGIGTAPGHQQVVILLFPGESSGAAEAAIAVAGGSVNERSQPTNPSLLFRAEVPRAAVDVLAQDPAIAWIEPWAPMRALNDRDQWVLQTFVSGSRRIWDNGITGSGQVMNSVDSGVRADHNAYRDTLVPILDFGDYPTHRKIIAYRKAADTGEIAFGDHSIASYHGTHTGGTLVGNDEPFGASVYDGMARDAKLYFLDAGGPASDGIIVPNDLYSMYLMPYEGNGGGAARLSSNSWGSAVAGAYSANAMQVDQFMWDHQDFLFFFSNGNNGGAGTVGSPATAKNCVSAGGTQNGTSATQIYTSTSRGPTDDGRRKPTVCAPANLISSYGSSQTAYQSLTGTSMSCPGLAGTMLLARQYLMEGRYPGGTADATHAFTPSGSLLKAMAVNCGQNDVSGFTVPDNNVGWGRVKLDDVLYLPGDTRHTVLVDEGEGLLTGEYVEYEFHVSDTSLPLKMSLVWTDPPGSPAAGRQLVNDLNLTATTGATTYIGNVFTGGQSTTGGVADSLNVEECVWRITPAAGTWKVRVTGRDVPLGPQPYSLVVSGGLGGDAGVVMLDSGYYNGGDTLHIQVEDLNGGASVNVSVSSTTEPAAETVALAAVGSGVYQGTFPTGMLGLATGDGRITVGHGDLVTVSYTDSSPAHTAHATATVFVNGPVISGVSALAVVSTRATIGWTTSSVAGSRVHYGTTPALGSSTTLDPSQVTAHAVGIDGLASGVTYYYDVESTDHYGNTVRDDNGGGHYTFTTQERGDVLVVFGDDTFIGENVYHDALTRSGWTWDEWTEPLALAPPVGDLASGLRSYPAVWWQVGWQQYPPFSDAARDSIARYNAGGGRMSVVSHDVAFAFGDSVNSPDWTAAREQWLADQLHATWQVDPSTFGQVRGIAGDPISGAYPGLTPYAAPFSGGAGDEVDLVHGTGTANYVWRDNRFVPDDIAVRWVNGAASGSPDSALWGGTATREVSNFFEWSRLNSTVTDDTTRAGILDKTILWLVGRDHPTVAVTAPNGGEVFTSGPVTISWSESFDAASAASRRIEYSDDGGQSWHVLSAAAGPSPYSWDISSAPNATTYLVRVGVRDNGSPALSGRDVSNAIFTVNRPGGDTRGPVVAAGTAVTSPNPVTAPGTFILSAMIDDAHTGNSNIAAAEWTIGAHALPPGSGTPLIGAFSSPAVTVRDTVNAATISGGYVPVWIRGQDAAGAWGPADSITIIVNGGATSVDGGLAGPAVFALGQNIPNPFNPATTIRFSLPASGPASLVIFDVNGRPVRRLAGGVMAAGRHEVRWDGRDDRGRRAASGIYFYRLEAGERSTTEKMVLVK